MSYSLVGAEIIAVTYGINVQEENDPWVEGAENVMDAVDHCVTPGAYLVDLLPICKSYAVSSSLSNAECLVKYVPQWMPGAAFQRQARRWKTLSIPARDKPWEHVKNRMVCCNEPAPSLSYASTGHIAKGSHVFCRVRCTILPRYCARRARPWVHGMGGSRHCHSSVCWSVAIISFFLASSLMLM